MFYIFKSKELFILSRTTMAVGGSKHQCLLFLCLLRYSSAFASSREAIHKIVLDGRLDNANRIASSTTMRSTSSSTQIDTPFRGAFAKGDQPSCLHASIPVSSEDKTVLDGHICLRLATRDDVSDIQRCNLATLPENYNTNFYCSHMRQWPELALVAEHIPASVASGNNSFSNRSGGSNIARFFGAGYDPSNSATNRCRIVGYVLGKVDDNYSSSVDDYFSHGGVAPASVRRNLQGHVTSLAILHPYRRKGLAQQLMNQLHHNMQEHYRTDLVGLHVRVSNYGAIKLYEGDLGYQVQELIHNYYQDGEDAYLMQKHLERPSNEMNRGSSNERKQIMWFESSYMRENPRPESEASSGSFRLPRIVWNFDSHTLGEDDGHSREQKTQYNYLGHVIGPK